MQNQKGQSIGEWTVAVIAISVTIMATLFAFAPSMNGVFNSINSGIDSSNQSETSGTSARGSI